jgi:hypothetical protein
MDVGLANLQLLGHSFALLNCHSAKTSGPGPKIMQMAAVWYASLALSVAGLAYDVPTGADLGPWPGSLGSWLPTKKGLLVRAGLPAE